MWSLTPIGQPDLKNTFFLLLQSFHIKNKVFPFLFSYRIHDRFLCLF